jgi:hypothetical protein
MISQINNTIDLIKQYTINPIIIQYGKKIEQRKFTDTPIIIGACPRSGTTLLLSILGASKYIFAIQNQTAAFVKWEQIVNSQTGTIDWFPKRLDRLYREFLFNDIKKEASRWLEKTPRHIQFFEKILNFYGDNILLINLVRDGRDVVTSSHPKYRPDEYYLDVERWVNDVGLGLELKDHPQVLTVRYEDIVFDFEITMKKIYKFLKAEIPDSLHDWKKNTSIKKSIHWDKPVQDLYRDSIARWKRPEHKKRLDEFLNNNEAVRLLKVMGYD